MNINLVVARENDNTFNTYFVPSARRFSVPCFQIGDKPDDNGNIVKKTITDKYFIMSQMLIDNKAITDDSVVVFIHEDINILDDLFIEKINMAFSDKPEIGVLGVAGVKQIPKEGWWFDESNDRVGHIVQGRDGKNITEGDYTSFGAIGYFDDCVAVEGCILAVRGSLIKNGMKFDVQTFVGDRDMYAMDICMQTLQRGYKVAVADILVYHRSERPRTISDSWISSKAKFNEKYKDLQFPIKASNFEIKNNEVMEVEI